MHGPPRIGDYGAIGDGRSAALVSRAGSVDWLCWPRFDSPSLFGAILDAERGGTFRIAPLNGGGRSERRYLPGTNVLETRFQTASGSLRVTDFMPVYSEEEKKIRLVPEHELLRRIECDGGEVEVDVRYAPRPAYGSKPVALRDAGPHGIRLESGGALIMLRTDAPLSVAETEAQGKLRLRAGEKRDFSVIYNRDAPAVLAPLGERVTEALAHTVQWWERWSTRCHYDGPYRDQVVRSALLLKLLAFAPSGAIIAAPTTSLPERMGGDLNWDYRYCWLRDAAFTTRALVGLGYTDEAEAFTEWLLHATRLTRPKAKILYDVYGNPPARERELSHWRGFGGSSPARVGNAADAQVQLDVYGDIVDSVARLCRGGMRLDRATGALLSDFARYVCEHWDQPDHGIWEPRSGKAHHTHSRVLCWTALTRLLEISRMQEMPGFNAERVESERAAIRQQVETRGFNSRIGSYVAVLDGVEVDGALLLLPWYGYTEAASPRMLSTFKAVEKRLGVGDGRFLRYRNDESPGEGAFAAVSFWAAEVLALGCGSVEEGRNLFATALRHANDLGLFGEEFGADHGEALGNFPQAYTHVGVINAALSLEQRARAQPAGASRPAERRTMPYEERPEVTT